jgi:hypothetical protein
MRFYEMSPEVAAASADLYAEAHPLYRCPCGFSTASAHKHAEHRTGRFLGEFYQLDDGCDATWVKP